MFTALFVLNVIKKGPGPGFSQKTKVPCGLLSKVTVLSKLSFDSSE